MNGKIDIRVMNKIRGFLAELVIAEYYLNKGWKVVKLQPITSDGQLILNKKGKDVFRNEWGIKQLKDYKQIMKDLDRAYEHLKKQKRLFHYPDFVCEKGEKINYVEVKATTKEKKVTNSTVQQKESLEALEGCKHGKGIVYQVIIPTMTKPEKYTSFWKNLEEEGWTTLEDLCKDYPKTFFYKP
ncbi:MAG TPA: hypothetical protein VJH95_06125 [Candidatus Nanoarchaeia archaeon]|nr:hypothetical protein [Candidatus Nanoarchaeia archaeon]